MAIAFQQPTFSCGSNQFVFDTETCNLRYFDPPFCLEGGENKANICVIIGMPELIRNQFKKFVDFRRLHGLEYFIEEIAGFIAI